MSQHKNQNEQYRDYPHDARRTPNDLKLTDAAESAGGAKAAGTNDAQNVERREDSGVRCSALLNQSLREAVLARVVVFVDGEVLMEQAWMLLW